MTQGETHIEGHGEDIPSNTTRSFDWRPPSGTHWTIKGATWSDQRGDVRGAIEAYDYVNSEVLGEGEINESRSGTGADVITGNGGATVANNEVGVRTFLENIEDFSREAGYSLHAIRHL